MNEAIVIDANVLVELIVSEADLAIALITSTDNGTPLNVMRCSKCSHMA